MLLSMPATTQRTVTAIRQNELPEAIATAEEIYPAHVCMIGQSAQTCCHALGNGSYTGALQYMV